MSPRRTTTGYRALFLYPSTSLMIRSGLWLGLETTIGFLVGLGLGSLIGQRTVAVILMIVLEVILTPILSTHVIPHLLNAAARRGGPGHRPSGTGRAPIGLRGRRRRTVGGHAAAARVADGGRLCRGGWLVGWTALGAWRMVTRDA